MFQGFLVNLSNQEIIKKQLKKLNIYCFFFSVSMKIPTMHWFILRKPVPLPLLLILELRMTGTRTAGTSQMVHQCYKLNLELRKCSHPCPVDQSRKVMNCSSYDQRLPSYYCNFVKPKQVLQLKYFLKAKIMSQ